MDEKGVIKRFLKAKVLTIEQLVSMLGSSAITARRKLKNWSAFTSIRRFYPSFSDTFSRPWPDTFWVRSAVAR